MTLTSPPEAPPGLATAAGRWKWLATLYPEHPQALEFTPHLDVVFSPGDGRAVVERLPIPSGLSPSGRGFFIDFQGLALESRPALA
jgi:hypothetical protein